MVAATLNVRVEDSFRTGNCACGFVIPDGKESSAMSKRNALLVAVAVTTVLAVVAYTRRPNEP